MSDGPADRDHYLNSLRRVLASDEFMASPQLSAFLTFVVGRTLDGRGDTLKAYTIATEVFRRKSDFNPQIDPIVRVEATRLRRALERFYGTVGSSEPVRIVLPRGGYAVRFDDIEADPLRSAAHQGAGLAVAAEVLVNASVAARVDGLQGQPSLQTVDAGSAVSDGDSSASGLPDTRATLAALVTAVKPIAVALLRNAAFALCAPIRTVRFGRVAGLGTIFTAVFLTFGASAMIGMFVQEQYPNFLARQSRAKAGSADVFAVNPVKQAQRPVMHDRLASILVEPPVYGAMTADSRPEVMRNGTGAAAFVAAPVAGLIDAFPDDLRMVLSAFEGISVLVGNDPSIIDQNSLFVLRSRVISDHDGERLLVHLTKAHFGVIVWSATFPLKNVSASGREALLRAVATGVAGENSSLVRFLAREQATSQLASSTCIAAVSLAGAFPTEANLTAAAACSEAWLAANPKSSSALRLSATTVLKSREAGLHESSPLDAAYGYARQAVALDPSSARARSVYADVLFAQGRVREAIDEGMAAVSTNPFDGDVAAKHIERTRRASFAVSQVNR